MTNSPPSLSEGEDAYDRFHPEIRRWIREQGWDRLREVQQKASRALFDSRADLLISASTAAGKTEAAFLPLLSQVAGRQEAGVAILYVAPLKALINDQYVRLSELGERLEMPIVRWHGDAPAGPKTAILRNPKGVVLITPESIEAMLIRRPGAAESLFGRLDAIIIDELHAFLQGARGLHLWSLLNRMEALNETRARRIGLSATLGDLAEAAKWLSGTARQPPNVVVVEGASAPIKLQVRAYIEPPESTDRSATELPAEYSALSHIAAHAFDALRGQNNLFFAGSRGNVEELADRLRTLSDERSVPNEFFPHHGSLSKELREELEARLKLGRLPTTAVATTTLELGIDIGSVHAVGQLGAPRSLASLRQRLGRSGRREGASAIFRNYVREPFLAADADPLDRLHLPVVQAVAAMNLLRARFVEPPRPNGALLSVLLHQLLSYITQAGGCSASGLYTALCGGGPFSAVSKRDFASLLHWMGQGEEPLLEQAQDRTLLLGPMGERIVAGRDFYANFKSPEEWRLVHQGRTLGTLPIINLLAIGSIVGFAGRRWRVIAVDDPAKVVEVASHRAGKIPKFDRVGSEAIHDRLAHEMRLVLSDSALPGYLDPVARGLLLEGRQYYADLGMARFLDAGSVTHVMTWRGSDVNGLFAVLLSSIGFECETFDVGVTLTNASINQARDVVAVLEQCPPVAELGHFVTNLTVEKYDELIPEALHRAFWVRRHEHLSKEISSLLQELQQVD